MTANEIRLEVTPMVIWMADAAIREARRAINYNKGPLHSYNLPEVDVATAVLFKMFNTFPAAIKEALLRMPEKMNGYISYVSLNYFDEFVKSLDKELHTYKRPDEVELRQTDWILEKL